VFLCISSYIAVAVDCNQTSCVQCAENGCRWCPDTGCHHTHSIQGCSGEEGYDYEDTCPVTWNDTPEFLSNWMGEMSDIIGELCLLDLSLPGTHDTLTYHLSTIVSDGGADDFIKLAEVLHEYESVIPDGIEDFIRQQSQTQVLNITSQLDNGIRFLDIRQMLEYSDENPEWHSLHFMESIETSIAYFTEIREWMDAHPSEVVVLWLSKHGSTCKVGEDQYPNVSVEEKQAFWATIKDIFSGIITDFSVTSINETSISTMLSRNHRAVFYVSDYEEFTGSSKYALDGCLIDNKLSPGIDDEVNSKDWELEQFKNANATKAADKAEQKLFLISLSTGIPDTQIEKAAKIKFLPSSEEDVAECAAAFNIPGMNWCPQTLLDCAQLENYYKQITLEEVISQVDYGFPNAIYINAIDWEGTIRTGTEVLWGGQRDGSDPNHQTSAYAYVDTMLLYNLRVACGGDENGQCGVLKSTLEARRSKYPAQYWDDVTFGRLVDWP